jgi:1-deoxy-D-xylulose-5-phosphate synthase
MVLPDRFIEHNTPAAQLAEAGLTAKDIVRTVVEAQRSPQPLKVAAQR